jgi:hypothetical protein
MSTKSSFFLLKLLLYWLQYLQLYKKR